MRGKKVPQRDITPDPKYNSQLIAKFINHVMRDGKKSVARQVVYQCLTILETKTKQPAVKVFEQALRNVAPSIEVKGRRIGGANYQVPTPVTGERKNNLSFRWLIEAARNKKGKSMGEKLAQEMILAMNNEGDAIKKKQEVQRMAEANRAFAHFANYRRR